MKSKYNWLGYPAEQRARSGCKVGWLIYDKRSDAELAAKAAEHNGRIKEQLGYDFGYCSPGNIRVLENGQFEVTIP
jgi:hypothetical protein